MFAEMMTASIVRARIALGFILIRPICSLITLLFNTSFNAIIVLIILKTTIFVIEG